MQAKEKNRPFRLKNLLHSSLIYTLCLSLLLTSSYGISAPAANRDQDEIDALITKDLERSQELESNWSNLEKIPAGQPRSSLPADRFLLFEQSVLPKEVPVVSNFPGQVLRLHKIAVLLGKIEKYQKQIAQGKAGEKTFEDPEAIPTQTDDEIRKLTLEHIENGRRSDTPYFIWVRRQNMEELSRAHDLIVDIYQKWQQGRRQKVENYTEAPTTRRARIVNWWDLTIAIKENQEVEREMNMDATSKFSAAGTTPYFCSDSSCTFDINLKKETLHRFKIQSKVVATYGPYLVFTHSDSFDQASGVQYLSYLDLETYSTAIGNEDIPVFRIPIKMGEPIHSLKIVNKNLIINDKFWVAEDILRDASDAQQMAFNLTGNLVDPKSWESVLPLVDSFRLQIRKLMEHSVEDAASEIPGFKKAEVLLKQLGSDLDQQLKQNSQIKPTVLNKTDDTVQWAKDKGIEQAAIKTLETYHERVSQSEALNSRMSSITTKLALSKKLKARIDLLIHRLFSPRPGASQKIKESIAIISVNKNLPLWNQRGLMAQILDRPYLNAGVISAAMMAYIMPEAFQSLMASGLSVGGAVLDYFNFAFTGLGESILKGTERTFAALYEPAKALSEQYVNNGNWYRTTLGLTSFVSVIAGIYFIPHFLFNYFNFRKDIRSGKAKKFIDQQNQFKKEYFDRLANEEAVKRSGESKISFSEHEEKQIAKYITDRKDGNFKKIDGKKKRGWFSRWFGKDEGGAIEKSELVDTSLSEQKIAIDDSLKASESSPALADLENGKEEFKSFWSAAKNFAISHASFELTLHRWASVWNWYSGWRYCSIGFAGPRICRTQVPMMILPKPVLFTTRLLYPDFFATVVARGGEKQKAIPTQLNGGMKNRLQWAKDGIRRFWLERFRSKNQGTGLQQLKTLEAFEDQIIAVEKEIVDVAFRESLGAMSKFITDPKDREILYGPNPLKSLTSDQIKDLSNKAKVFLRAHFESIYNDAMSKFLNDFVEKQKAAESTTNEQAENQMITESETSEDDLSAEVPAAALTQLKSTAVKQAIDSQNLTFKFDLEKARQLALTSARNNPKHYQQAEAQAKKGVFSIKNFLMNQKYDAVSDLDPEQNKSMARWAVVHKRLQSPGALGRAVRAEIAKLLWTFPLDLGFRLFLTAGIMEGAFKPIQEEFWGPNSTVYLSHSAFYMIMASGFTMSMMADAWLKVQQDQRQDDMGEFNAVPKGEDAVRGISRWYAKNFFAASNSLISNYKFNFQLIFWNLPAALLNMAVFSLLFANRVDLSLILAGYAVAFGTPLSAFHMKVEQAFERAVLYAARGIKDERWLAHPKIQELITKEQQRLRNRFTLMWDMFSSVEGNLVANIETIPTSIGTRGFARSLFGGKLLEESLIENVFIPLQQAAHNIPVIGPTIEKAAKACEFFLSNGNPDLIKTPKK